MKKTKTLKSFLKKIYKEKKRLDGKDIGKKKNDFTQALHLQLKLPVEKRDKDLYKQCLEGVQMINKEHRFRDDFPSFSRFYAYVTDEENGFTLDDIKTL